MLWICPRSPGERVELVAEELSKDGALSTSMFRWRREKCSARGCKGVAGPVETVVSEEPREKKRGGKVRGLSWWFSGSDSLFPKKGAQVQSLVRELDSAWASLLAQRLKCLPPMWETRVWFLGWEDPLDKEMVTHSSSLAWRIPWAEKPGRLQSTGLQRVGTTELLHLHLAATKDLGCHS